MSSFSATVQTEIVGKQATVFDHIVPIDLTSIFTGYGPLPAVTGVQNQTGAWNAAGQTRTVTFSDGSSAREQLTKYEHPHYFSYMLSDFSGVLGFLSMSANGAWWFETNPSTGTTLIKWSYVFNARSLFTGPILWLITNFLWRGYMHKALMLSKSQIEGCAAQRTA
jgi:hypothetical protein